MKLTGQLKHHCSHFYFDLGGSALIRVISFGALLISIFYSNHLMAQKTAHIIAMEQDLMIPKQQPFILALVDKKQIAQWQLINDTVMGGISNSQLEASSDVATFSGQLSLEQNGGFASTRTQISATIPHGLNLIRLKVRGDGRSYQLRLRTDEQWDSFAYSSAFQTEKDTWQTLEFIPTDFKAVYRGRAVNAPELNYDDIKQIGFLVADKQAGWFELSFTNIELTTAK